MQSTTATNVRAEMARRGVTQTVLAESLGISAAAMSRRLCGHTDFTVGEITAAAARLGVPLSLLLPDDERTPAVA